MEYFEEMKKQWELKASQLKESQVRTIFIIVFVFFAGGSDPLPGRVHGVFK